MVWIVQPFEVDAYFRDSARFSGLNFGQPCYTWTRRLWLVSTVAEKIWAPTQNSGWLKIWVGTLVRVDFWLFLAAIPSIKTHPHSGRFSHRTKKNFAKKNLKHHSIKSDASRQIDDRLSWVSTIRNEKIAQSFTTLGSIKVVYSSFEMIAQ